MQKNNITALAYQQALQLRTGVLSLRTHDHTGSITNRIDATCTYSTYTDLKKWYNVVSVNTAQDYINFTPLPPYSTHVREQIEKFNNDIQSWIDASFVLIPYDKVTEYTRNDVTVKCISLTALHAYRPLTQDVASMAVTTVQELINTETAIFGIPAPH